MRKIIAVLYSFFFLFSVLSLNVPAKETDRMAKELPGASKEPTGLNSKACVLMDASTGRILFEKDCDKPLAMASTTKIMTCILILENMDIDKEVTFDKEGSTTPKVRLGAGRGESFKAYDLLHSLMLESHNDSAVVLAKALCGNVSDFATLMNKKAKELGLSDTYFITPNGLDANDDKSFHHTTAADLALIMKYCICDSPKKEEFIAICQKDSYSFKSLQGRSYTVNGHNTLKRLTEGVICGKTGYTGGAGYCYVGAVKRDNRIFIISILGCGWPPNKNLRFEDSIKLIDYGMTNYRLVDLKDISLDDLNRFNTITVENGFSPDNLFCNDYNLKTSKNLYLHCDPYNLLVNSGSRLYIKSEMPLILKAPLKEGEIIGKAYYMIDETAIMEFEYYCNINIPERTYKRVFSNIIYFFMLK